MSLGLSPSDAVLFVNFVGKVISSLRAEGGSQSQYQVAEQQCQGFLAVMTELQKLDLSSVPQSFRDQLGQHSTNTKIFVEEFHKNIAKYENSMGKSSRRGWLTSTPRKVQWAFLAADDLDKFRKMLILQLNLVKLVIQAGLLSMVGNLNRRQPLLLGRSQSLMLKRGPYWSAEQAKRYSALSWYRHSLDGLSFVPPAAAVGNLIYERLLGRPVLPLASHREVDTLPEQISGIGPQPALNTILEKDAAESAVPSSSVQQPPEQQDIADQNDAVVDETERSTLVSEINEYLCSLNLKELSEEEVEQLNIQNVSLLLQNYQEYRSERVLQSYDSTNEEIGSGSEYVPRPEQIFQKSRFRSHLPSFSFGSEPLGLALSIVGLVQNSVTVAYFASKVYRTIAGEPRELKELSRRVWQYSSLLRIAGEVIEFSDSAEDILMLGREIVRDSSILMDELGHLLQKLQANERGRLFKALSWRYFRAGVIRALEKMESLKSTLSLMLQLYEIQQTEHKFAAMRGTFPGPQQWLQSV